MFYSSSRLPLFLALIFSLIITLSASAQSGVVPINSNINTTAVGGIGLCQPSSCVYFEGAVGFSVPAGQTFVLRSITLTLDNLFGSEVYNPNTYIRANQGGVPGTYLQTPGRAFISPGAITTVTLGTNPQRFNGGDSFFVVVSGFGPYTYGGWRISNAQPTGLLTYTGSLVSDDDDPFDSVEPWAGIGQHFMVELGVEQSGISVSPTTLNISEGGAVTTVSLTADSTPEREVIVPVSASAECEVSLTNLPGSYSGTVNAVLLQGTTVSSEVFVRAIDDTDIEGDHTCTLTTGDPTSDDAAFGTLGADDVADVMVNIADNDIAPAYIVGAPGATSISEDGGSTSFTLALATAPDANVDFTFSASPSTACTVTPLTHSFDAGNFATPLVLTITGVDDALAAGDRPCAVALAAATTATGYATLADPADIVVTILDDGVNPPPVTTPEPIIPTPPPTPLCADHNFSEGGVVRSGIPDSLAQAVNCRVLYQNSEPTSWLGGALYHAGSIGGEGVLALGVQQAVDIFSPAGLTYFEGGAVFCLRGTGSLIWFAASGVPRRAEIIGSYRVPDFPGFTCATLFEPGTLVLVSRQPA